MRTKHFLILFVVLTTQTFAQSSVDYELEMVFIPKGSFSYMVDSVKKTISVDAFWMSDEISNKQYREFTDYTLKHPDDTIKWIDPEGTCYKLKSNFKLEIKSCTYKDLFSDLIDSFAIANEYPINSSDYKKYKDYFTDKKFNNFPVVGVSLEMARFYCLWLQKMEDENNKKQGIASTSDYRLPISGEWQYAAGDNNDLEIKSSTEIQNIRFGKRNKFGLYNIFGNVSEWTLSSSVQNLYAVLGSSWKNNKIENPLEWLDKNAKTGYVGFRVVKSYVRNKN